VKRTAPAEEPEKDAEEKQPDDEEKKQPDLPPKKVQVRSPDLPLSEAGKIRDLELNRAIARQLIERWREETGASKLAAEKRQVTIESELEEAASVTLAVARDGRCRASLAKGGEATTVVFDGQRYWLSKGKEPLDVTPAKASRDPWFQQAIILATLLTGEPPHGFGPWQLDGADQADGQLTYRLSTTDDQSEQLFLWLTVADAAGKPSIALVKSGVGIDDDEPIPSTIYRDPVASQPVRVAGTRVLVRGLGEEPVAKASETTITWSETIDEQQFSKP
jgi:hypothetical protein